MRTSDGGDPDVGGSGAFERGGAGAGGGAGGVDVVDEEDVAAVDPLGMRDRKSAAHVGTTLMGGEPRLTVCGALPFEQPCLELQMERGLLAAQGSDGRACQPIGLVEAALAALAPVEGDGDDGEVRGQAGDLADLVGQKDAEALGDGLEAVVFEQVQEAAQGPAINAVGDGFFKVGGRGAAGAAEGICRIGAGEVEGEGFAAAEAAGPELGGQAVPAGGADGKEGKTRKREAADAAIGGEEDGGEAVGYEMQGTARRTSEHANHSAPGRHIGRRSFTGQGNTLTEDAPQFGGPGLLALDGCSIRGSGSGFNRENRGFGYLGAGRSRRLMKGKTMAADALRNTLTPARVDELARAAGFTAGGIAAVPEPGSTEDLEERARFAEWIEAGRAGEMEYLQRRDEAGRLLRSSVRVVFPWARSVVVCAANYNSAQPRSVDAAEPGRGWIARYAWTGRDEDGGTRATDYHKVLLKRLKDLRTALEEEAGPFESRCFVDTGPVVERVYARYAGLGWTGKNTCLLNQELGSWLFLGVMVTSLEVAEGRAAILAPDRCGSCTRCLEACPTGALTGPREMDANLCISYLTIEKRGAIPEGLRAGIGRQVFGCDICQDVCPWNRRAPIAVDPEMGARGALVNPALEWLAGMDEAEFERWFNGSPVRRAKFAGFRRNVAIAMGNSGEARFLPLLEAWTNDGDPVLAETARWAAERLRAGHNEDPGGP